MLRSFLRLKKNASSFERTCERTQRPFERMRCSFERKQCSFERTQCSFERTQHSFEKNARAWQKNATLHSLKECKRTYNKMSNMIGHYKINVLNFENFVHIKK